MNDELKALDAEFAELDAEFAELAMEDLDVTDPELQEFEALVREAGLEPEAAVGGLAELTVDEQVEMQFFISWLRKKAAKLLKKLVKLARKYARRCRSAIPLVTKAVRLFKDGKYIASIKAAYDAYRAIRRCLS